MQSRLGIGTAFTLLIKNNAAFDRTAFAFMLALPALEYARNIARSLQKRVRQKASFRFAFWQPLALAEILAWMRLCVNVQMAAKRYYCAQNQA